MERLRLERGEGKGETEIGNEIKKRSGGRRGKRIEKRVVINYEWYDSNL